MSGCDSLIESKYIDEETFDKAMGEFKTVRRDPNTVFMYSFMRSEARVLNEY